MDSVADTPIGRGNKIQNCGQLTAYF